MISLGVFLGLEVVYKLMSMISTISLYSLTGFKLAKYRCSVVGIYKTGLALL